MTERLIAYKDAISEALAQEMRRDPTVIVYGLDVPDHKRIFGSTARLLEEFGPDRVFGTPLSEDAMTGVALGAAINGLRPVHVHIRVDFALLGMNQIVNMMSSFRYMSGGTFKAPLVIRAVIGRGWGQSAQHSKSMQSVFAHIPGIKVIMPTTPYDVKGMLTAAIRDDGPVICLEHRWLYEVMGAVPEEPYTVPLGEPRVVVPGSDVTVVATSWMTVEAKMAAELLRSQGVSVEVIDARSIAPLDLTLILESARKTGRVVIADYDWTWCGFSAELAAQIGEQCFGALKAPIRRIGFEPVPCPTTRPLENLYYANAEEIVRSIEGLLGRAPMSLEGVGFYSWSNKFKGPF
jgi:pyruvate dehydrogenase E1 component beta subunit